MATQMIPKLARTVTDAYGDELYSPNFHLTTSRQSPAAKVETYHSNDIFAQTLHAANSHHFGMHPTQAYHTSRGRSPFREGAPLAPAPGNMAAARTSSNANQVATPSSRVSTDTSRPRGGAYGLATVGGHPSEPNTPHTISPKDTFLDYHPEGDDDFTLFGPTAGPYPAADVSKIQQGTQNEALMSAEQARQPAANFGFYPVGMPFEVQSRLPQQYPFVRQPQLQPLVAANAGRGGHQLANVRHTVQGSTTGLSNKPAGASADGGTYTCTYHGCSLRFETPALLQKHKREGHRQAHGLNSAGRRLDSNSTPGLFNTQSGPHKCDRINPTTGKPCNTIFSRPYDLTRHEDTIHNIRKLKVRCEICTEEKTFSRADALTRHFRVCHPGVEIPTKHRKRLSH